MLQPALKRFLPDYPDVKVEIIVDYGLTDIVAEGFDAGVRMGEQVAKDMIAVRIGPEMRMAVVGSPDYFARFPPPKTPQDLTGHNCINMRLPTYGGLFPWGSGEGRARGEGSRRWPTGLQQPSLAAEFGAGRPRPGLCAGGPGASHIADGRLVRVLEDWCPPFPGYHLYYPSRRHPSPALTLLVDVLRYRG